MAGRATPPRPPRTGVPARREDVDALVPAASRVAGDAERRSACRAPVDVGDGEGQRRDASGCASVARPAAAHLRSAAAHDVVARLVDVVDRASADRARSERDPAAARSPGRTRNRSRNSGADVRRVEARRRATGGGRADGHATADRAGVGRSAPECIRAPERRRRRGRILEHGVGRAQPQPRLGRARESRSLQHRHVRGVRRRRPSRPPGPTHAVVLRARARAMENGGSCTASTATRIPPADPRKTAVAGSRIATRSRRARHCAHVEVTHGRAIRGPTPSRPWLPSSTSAVFIDRAGDEVRSWFGDDDAERRRQMDDRDRYCGSRQVLRRGPSAVRMPIAIGDRTAGSTGRPSRVRRRSVRSSGELTDGP